MNPRLRTLFTFILTFTLLLPAAPMMAAEKNTKGGAAELISGAQRSVGVVVRAAQSDPALQSGKAEAKPFWDAMKGLNESLDKAQTGLTLKDETFFSNLAVALAQSRQAEIAVTMNKSSNAELKKGMEKLSATLNRLNENYSKEAARLKQGGPLTPTEVSKLEKLKSQQDELLKKLAEVEKNAAANNEQMKKGIEEIRKASKRIRRSDNTAAGFVGGFFAAHLISGWLWGWHWWWGPWGGWCPGWIDINVDIWVDWVDVVDYDWDLMDYDIDVADLGLDDLDISDMDLEETGDYLYDSDFSLEDGDLESMTDDLNAGWDDIDTEMGEEALEGTIDNFDLSPYESDVEANTFDNYEIEDYGEDFGEMDF